MTKKKQPGSSATSKPVWIDPEDGIFQAFQSEKMQKALLEAYPPEKMTSEPMQAAPASSSMPLTSMTEREAMQRVTKVVKRVQEMAAQGLNLDGTPLQPGDGGRDPLTPSTTGQPIKSAWDSFPTASPDDPIFSRGFVIGSKRSTPSSPITQATPSPSENKAPKK